MVPYRLRAELEDDACPVQPTAGGRGAEIPLIAYIHQVLERSPPPQGVPLYIKFAFDGATMTSGTRTQEEVGAFQFLYTGQKLADVKSPSNSHMWIIYIGAETPEILR
jgi:hypothetical protein